MPGDVVRAWCSTSFVSHTSEPDHRSPGILGNVDERESKWNIWKEDHKWLTYSEVSWINVTTPPYMVSHCFLSHLFSTGVKQINLLQITVWIQILRNYFMQQNRKIPPERPHATSFPTEALPWCCKPGCSVACDTSTMLLRTTGHGTEELKVGQLLPFQGPALLQLSYKRCTLVSFYCLKCQTWNNEVQSRFLINQVPLAGRKGTWVK